MDKFEKEYYALKARVKNILEITVKREENRVLIFRGSKWIWFDKKQLATGKYSLASSAKDLGYIDKVHVAKDGEVLDGVHRLFEDPSWDLKWHPEIDTEEKKVDFKYSVQFKRRTNKTELRELINRDAAIFKATGNSKLGEYAEAIANKRGFTSQYIRRFLKDEYKDLSQQRKREPKEDVRETVVSPKLSKSEMLDELLNWLDQDSSKIAPGEKGRLLALKDLIVKRLGG